MTQVTVAAARQVDCEDRVQECDECEKPSSSHIETPSGMSGDLCERHIVGALAYFTSDEKDRAMTQTETETITTIHWIR